MAEQPHGNSNFYVGEILDDNPLFSDDPFSSNFGQEKYDSEYLSAPINLSPLPETPKPKKLGLVKFGDDQNQSLGVSKNPTSSFDETEQRARKSPKVASCNEIVLAGPECNQNLNRSKYISDNAPSTHSSAILTSNNLGGTGSTALMQKTLRSNKHPQNSSQTTSPEFFPSCVHKPTDTVSRDFNDVVTDKKLNLSPLEGVVQPKNGIPLNHKNNDLHKYKEHGFKKVQTFLLPSICSLSYRDGEDLQKVC